MMTPKFTHDCDWCIFIGRVERGEGVWREGSQWGVENRRITWPAGDLWLHPSGGLLVRTGSDGPEYSSLGDAYFDALPDEWKKVARSIWRHYGKPDEYDYERMCERRTERRQDRRIRRKGLDPLQARMDQWLAEPTGLPDKDHDEVEEGRRERRDFYRNRDY